MTIAEAQQRIAALKNQIATLKPMLADTDDPSFDAIAAKVDALIDEHDKIQAEHPQAGRVSHPITPGQFAPPAATAPKAQGDYVDGQGNRVLVLASDQRLGDHHAPTVNGFGQRQEIAGVGSVIRALVTGQNMDEPMIQAALSGGTQTAGGYMLNPFISSQVIDLARSESVTMRAGARTVSMPTSELILLKVDTDPTVSWVSENQQLSTTEAAFGRLKFRARKFGAIVPLSRELIEDAPNAEAEIERLLRITMAQELDRAILLGDGDGEEPVGIFNHPDVTENAIGGAVDWDDFIDSLQAVEDANGTPNAIIMPPSVKASLAKLKVNSEANHYASAPEILDPLSGFVTTKLATSQAVLGDFTQVMVGVRRGVEIVASSLVDTGTNGFSHDQVLIKVTWRGDVQLEHGDHIEKLTGIS